MELNLDVPASHFSHFAVKGNSVAGRPCQSGGTGKMLSVTICPKVAFSGRSRGRAAVFTEGRL